MVWERQQLGELAPTCCKRGKLDQFFVFASVTARAIKDASSSATRPRGRNRRRHVHVIAALKWRMLGYRCADKQHTQTPHKEHTVQPQIVCNAEALIFLHRLCESTGFADLGEAVQVVLGQGADHAQPSLDRRHPRHHRAVAHRLVQPDFVQHAAGQSEL